LGTRIQKRREAAQLAKRDRARHKFYLQRERVRREGEREDLKKRTEQKKNKDKKCGISNKLLAWRVKAHTYIKNLLLRDPNPTVHRKRNEGLLGRENSEDITFHDNQYTRVTITMSETYPTSCTSSV